MIEQLYKGYVYPIEIQRQIEQMGATAISIANRWLLGWEGEVVGLLENNYYLQHLVEQTELEKTILSEEPNSNHLSRLEILEIHGVNAFPPFLPST